MAAPFIIALDPAIHCGVCEGVVGGTPKLYMQQFKFGDDQHIDLFGAAAYFWASFLKDRKPDLVAIEAPIKNAGWGKTTDKTTTVTRGLYAVFVGIAKAKGIRVIDAPISTWRAFTLGKGNLKGPEAKRQCVELCKTLRWKAPDHNAAEAAGIWLWAGSQIAPKEVQQTAPLFARSAA